jgi:GntR family transcriptional regulator
MTKRPADKPSTSLVPRYVQIAETLIEQIESGELAPGARLPSERELSKHFGVNRMTLRQALTMLDNHGLLMRRQGDGTDIVQPKIERTAGHLFAFSKEMRSHGFTPSAQIILLEQRFAETSIAHALQLPVGAPIYYSHRLRLINRQPVMLEQFALPAQRFPGFATHDIETQSIYQIMATIYAVQISQARQSLEPVVANDYEAELLDIAPGSPLMLERRITFDTTMQAVEYSKDLYRGDRFRFVTELAPLEGGLRVSQADR